MPLEAVREFSVQSGSCSAEYGNVAGGVVNLMSKSGTNDWHGSIFEFLRSAKMDAANFFSNANRHPKNPLRYNQFGLSLGGPIRRDRTFLFADYQGTISRNAAPMLTTVPSDEQRRGDFSQLQDSQGSSVPIYDPFGSSLARTPFSGNVIPLNRMDPAAVKLTALLPGPNQFDVNGNSLPFNNYAVTRITSADTHAFDIRFDHQVSSQSTLFGRHSLQDTEAISPSLFGLPLGGSIRLAGTTQARNQNTGIGYTHSLKPTLISETRIGLNRVTSSLKQEDYGQNFSDQFGIPGVNRSLDTSGLPSINVAGLFGLGGSILTPLRLATKNWIFSERLMWAKGRHTLRFGFDYAYEMGSTGYLVFGHGNYTFLNLTTSTAVGPPGGNAFASFLLGAPFQVLRDQFPPGTVALISSRYGFYLQDDLKVHAPADDQYRRALRNHALRTRKV